MLSLAEVFWDSVRGQPSPYSRPDAQRRIDLIKYLARRSPPVCSGQLPESLLNADPQSHVLFLLCTKKPRIAVDPAYFNGKLFVDAAVEDNLELVLYILEISESLKQDEELLLEDSDDNEARGHQSRKASIISLRDPPPRHIRSWNQDPSLDIKRIPIMATMRRTWRRTIW